MVGDTGKDQLCQHGRTYFSKSKPLGWIAYYTKRKFIDPVLASQKELGCDIAIVGKLRKDANLHYLYQGPPSGKPGRPRELNGKVDFKDFSHLDTVEHTDERIVLTYVVKSKALKPKLRHEQLRF